MRKKVTFEKGETKQLIKKLWKYFRPYKWYMVLLFVISSIGCVLVALSPFLLKTFVQDISDLFQTSNVAINKIITEGLIIIIFLVAGNICQTLLFVFMAVYAQKIASVLRKEMTEKFDKIPLKRYDKTTIGDLSSRLSNDASDVGESSASALASIVNAVVLLVALLIAMFISSWQLSLVSLVTLPCGFALMALVAKKSDKHYKSRQKYLGAVTGKLEEVYSGLSVMRIFNTQKKETKVFSEANNELRKSWVLVNFFSGLFQPIMSFTGNLGYVGIAFVAALMAKHDPQSLVLIPSFIMFVGQLQNPLSTIAGNISTLQTALGGARRIFELLDAEEEWDESTITKVIKKPKGNIQFHHVRFGYDPGKEIIHDFNLKIKKGSKVAIVGPTGSGKTTIVNLLMRFYELNSGSIRVDGVNIKEIKREDVRKLFGMVLQDSWTFEGTIKENIIYTTPDVSKKKLVAACKVANIDHVIKTLPDGYKTVLNESSTLSVGEKQLLTIARAILQDSPFIILDEATSSVDTQTEQKIQDAMDKLIKGRTSFVIAHRLSTIKNADIILVLKDGNIIEQGSHKQLIKKHGFYEELYNSQFADN
ncbi:MAG: ABC transporter ATP-binding protein/permease [Mycoplasmataceae bacterium]|nr:ABC transporter ATP-binding protein/permease [Mycoplasmataceae bacterium]